MHRRVGRLLHSSGARKHTGRANSVTGRYRTGGLVPRPDLGSHSWHHHPARQGLPPYLDDHKDPLDLVRSRPQATTSAHGAAYEPSGRRYRDLGKWTVHGDETYRPIPYQYRGSDFDVPGTGPRSRGSSSIECVTRLFVAGSVVSSSILRYIISRGTVLVCSTGALALFAVCHLAALRTDIRPLPGQIFSARACWV
jgi:hypothetical protein